jgi:hypothetical protein
METIWEFLRDTGFGAQVWTSYKDVVRDCCDAWIWLVSDAIAPIGARKWVIL